MAEPYVVVYSGEDPPAAAGTYAERHGIALAPLLAGDIPTGEAGREQLLERLRRLDPEGYLMVGERPYLSSDMLDAMPRLSAVSFMGPSLALADHHQYMDLEALRRREIPVTAAPGCSTISVAEGTLALLCALNLDLVATNRGAKGGAAAAPEPRHTLWGSALGVVGMGRIGERVARLAAALGMHVRYYSRRRKWHLEDDLGARFAELPDLFAGSDYVSIHSTAALTRGMIGRRELARARGVRLVNTAAARIVDPEALLEALHDGRVRSAALDSLYPPPYREEFLRLDDARVVQLPFVSWNTHHFRERGWRLCLESQVARKQGRPVPYRLHAG